MSSSDDIVQSSQSVYKIPHFCSLGSFFAKAPRKAAKLPKPGAEAAGRGGRSTETPRPLLSAAAPARFRWHVLFWKAQRQNPSDTPGSESAHVPNSRNHRFSSRKSGFCSLSQPRRVLLRLFQRLKIQIHDNLRIQVTQRMPLTRLLTSGGNEPSPVVALCRLIGFNDRLRVYTDQQIGWGLFLASSGVRPEENHIHWW